MNNLTKKQNHLLSEIINVYPKGPWSWSDMMQHAATIVAYGILRYPDNDFGETADGILSKIKQSALFQIENATQKDDY